MNNKYSEDKPILMVSKNALGTDYIVGDIHGHLNKLLHKLHSINFDFNNDRLFSVGDVIDRGPDSIGCYNLLNEPWFYAVRGNHENMIAETAEAGYCDSFIMHGNGAGWFLELETPLSEHQGKYWRIDIAQDFSKLPYVIELDTPSGKVGIVHASPLCYDWNLCTKAICNNQQAMTDCIWDRSFYEECNQEANLGRSIKGIDYVVTGHNHAPEALIVNNFYSIATCWYQEGKDWDFVLVDTTDMSLV